MKLLALIALLGAACGGSSNSYATQCQAHCNPGTTGPCVGMDGSKCVADCEANTSGVSAACAQCVLDDTGWRETVGTGGTMCAGASAGSPASTHCAPLCK